MKLAPADSRLGQLQRGSGRGFLAALSAPATAGDELLACLRDDPRVDTQVERREVYYAELADRLALDLAPLLAAEDDGLSAAVLAQLVARGHPQARALIEQPRAHGELALAVLEELRSYPDWAAEHLRLPAVELLAEHLAERDELSYDVDFYPTFWERWRTRLPVVESAFVAAAARAAAEVLRAPAPLVDPGAMATADLLDQLGSENSAAADAELAQRFSEADRVLLAECLARGEARGVAWVRIARLLGSFGDLRLLDAAAVIFARTDLDASSPVAARERQRRAAYLHYVRALPAELILPLARAWWPRGGFLRTAAGQILAQHAQPQDRAMLEPFVQRAAAHGSYQAVAEIEALARIGDAGSVPVLLAVVTQATSSFARVHALRGLATHATDAKVAAVLHEALWDCEDDARLLGCRHADLGAPPVRTRLHELASWPLSDDDLRAAAVARRDAG